MEISFATFLQGITTSPALLVTTLLTLGGHLRQRLDRRPQRHRHLRHHPLHEHRAAIWMSALFNFLGVFIMTQINSSVASTISKHGRFRRQHPRGADRPLRSPLLDRRLQRRRLLLRHPHQREPQPDRRPHRRRHRHPERRRRHQHGRVGPRSSTASS